MNDGVARRLSERDLILPALLVLNEADDAISTTQLSARVRDLLKPSGEDKQILAGRQDDKFSQKVRNLRSHKTLEAPGYATYESRSGQGYWRITERGQRVLGQSSDFVKIALNPGFTSPAITQALSRLDYTNPKKMPRVMVFDEEEVIAEGGRSEIRQAIYERSKKLRQFAIQRYRDRGELRCEACGFSFETTYGQLGKDFIEIHHKKPIFCLHGQVVEQTILDAMNDVAALCANCHRMVHRRKNVVLSIEELRSILETRIEQEAAA